MKPWLRAMLELLGGGEVRRRRANPLLALYRWRWEILLLGVVGVLAYLGHSTSWVVPVGVVTAVAAVLVAWPPAYRALRARCWAVVVQHRLRTVFHELGLTTWAGRAPAIVWTSVRTGARDRGPHLDRTVAPGFRGLVPPAGIRVHLVCPAGIGAGELADVREQLAAACWAADVLVERDPRHANVVVLVVVTRVVADGT
jgi:hypothetical protein